EPLFPAMEPPKPSTNFEFQIANEALYLVAVSNPSSELREVFLTRDFRTYEPATLIFTGEDTAKPVPYAKVAPNENGLALVSVHDQLYYVPLTRRDPQTLEEALACGKKITDEKLARHFLSTGRQIAMALLMYAQDYDESFPLADTEVSQVLLPYLNNPSLLEHPLTKQPVFTYLLNGENLANIENPAETKMGIVDWGDPQFVVVIYVDGHAKMVPRNR
ncbi:MAG: hypothetical protein SNJ72_10995, partial [Fimbriimonadales bacterium]